MTAIEILNEVKSGNPFSYPATFTKGRIFTMTYCCAGSKEYISLTANTLKKKEGLTDEKALKVIENVLNS